MTQPDTLHTRLRAEIDRRLAVARAATPGEWKAMQYGIECEIWSQDLHRVVGRVFEVIPAYVASGLNIHAQADIQHIALHDPADAVRRYEGELEVMQRHVAETFGDSQLPEQLDLDPDQPWCRTCRGGDWPCADLIGLAHRLGVNIDG